MVKNGKKPVTRRKSTSRSAKSRRSNYKGEQLSLPIKEISSGEAEEELVNCAKQELCNQSTDGWICAAGLAQDSPTQELSYGEEAQTNSANKMTTVTEFSDSDIPIKQSGPISNCLDSIEEVESDNQNSLQLPLPVSLSARTENDLEQKMIETVSPTCSEQSEKPSPSSQSSKTFQDCSTAPIPPVTNQEVTSPTSSTPYRQMGTMRNGSVSGAMSLPLRGVGKGCLLLRSPGALSSEKGRPPGKTRLENQLQELNLISASEVAAPEFLELGYKLPIGFTNLNEQRTALELAQAQAQQLLIDHKSELRQEMEITAIVEAHSVTPLIGELPQLDSDESNTLIILPPNIGSLSKTELLSTAIKQHELISSIERREFELGIEKLHRARVTGLYLQEFKKRCRHGEFETELEANGIKPRRAQQYMSIAKNWEAIESEAKAQTVALLVEENQSFGIKWALDTIAQQKKALKSATPPSDPDCWRTPNTAEQPIVDLVKQALGGQIWCDPCADAGHKIPAVVHYDQSDDGLSEFNVWTKTVFINPPFSNPLPWVEKTCLSIARGNASAEVMLLKSGTLSNVGTGELINKYASAVCHWRGRIYFLNDEGKPVKGSDFDCVFVYFGDRLDLFRSAFEKRGTISTIENHFSSINKKYLNAGLSAFPEKPDFNSIRDEEKQLAAAVGLSNGKSILPDVRDRDRAILEQHDPHTVPDYVPTATEVENVIVDSVDDDWLKETAIGVISNSLEFSNAQAAKMISSLMKEDFDDRVKLALEYLSENQLRKLLELCDNEIDSRKF
jgi:DNA N-6-adenine-methyltransferase (Dam)